LAGAPSQGNALCTVTIGDDRHGGNRLNRPAHETVTGALAGERRGQYGLLCHLGQRTGRAVLECLGAQQTVSTVSGDGQRQSNVAVYTATGLSPGNHTIVVTKLSGTYSTLDGFTITDS
jgi:hypothetical protein